MDLQKDVIQREIAVQVGPPKVSNYKGISGAIRSAIVRGDLEGKITPIKVRKLLPLQKNDAPSKIIYKSLKYLAKRNEIKIFKGEYYPNSYDPPELQTQVKITGILLNTENIHGRMVARIAVQSMEVQK